MGYHFLMFHEKLLKAFSRILDWTESPKIHIDTQYRYDLNQYGFHHVLDCKCLSRKDKRKKRQWMDGWMNKWTNEWMNKQTNEWTDRVSVWEQRQYDSLLVGRQASQGCERQQSVAVHSIWEALYTGCKRYRLPKKYRWYLSVYLSKMSNTILSYLVL